MRILVVSQYFWPEQFRINDLVLGLKERGHEVSVLTGMPNYPAGRLFEGYRWWSKRHDLFEGMSVCRVPLFLRRGGRGWQLALNYLSFALAACVLGPWCFRKQAFDIVFVFEPSPVTVGIPAVLMRRLKRAPMLFWVQDLWPESLSATGVIRSPAILKQVGRMVSWIYRRCDRVLVQSRGFIEPAVATGADSARILYYPNWAEAFYRPLSRQQARLPDDIRLPQGFRVMFAGNLGEAQSLETIIAAARHLAAEKEVRWLMVGDGRRREWMRQEVVRLGLADRFSFYDRQPAVKMPDFFAHADALLATLKPEDVFARTVPSKVQSYMACARPVLAALDGEGARVIGEADCGLAVPAGDGESLADAVLKLYRMSGEERRAMGERGRAYYDAHFERDMLLDRLDHWMRDVKKEGLCAF